MSRDTRNMVIALVFIVVVLAIGWVAFRAGHVVGVDLAE